MSLNKLDTIARKKSTTKSNIKTSTIKTGHHVHIDDYLYFHYEIISKGKKSDKTLLKERHFSNKLESPLHLHLHEADEELIHEALFPPFFPKTHNKTTSHTSAKTLAELEQELHHLSSILSKEQPAFAHVLNLLNKKINHLADKHPHKNNKKPQPVSLSLAGLAFKTAERIKKDTDVHLVLYTRPHSIPIFLQSRVVYSECHDELAYRTAVEFEPLSSEQADLLSQHIISAKMAQVEGKHH